MTINKNLANLANTGQAISLLSHNFSIAKKKKKKLNDIFDLGISNLTGIAFIRATGEQISYIE